MVSLFSLRGINRQGEFSFFSSSGTNFIKRHSLHGCVRAGSPRFRQLGESSKMNGGRQGVRGEPPYPPSSTKFSSNLRSSSISCSSCAIDHLSPYRVCSQNA